MLFVKCIGFLNDVYSMLASQFHLAHTANCMYYG